MARGLMLNLASVDPAHEDEIRCESSLGGLLNHYYTDQKAA